ncbi:sugar O-acetyltransferase [Raoultibacter phocaeensis]|uniref:sugar O-acetyltransferase n=1 Tax=Raoultibacter phocaeensis TaxID=2479841 RepID=UPI00111B3EDC|nr:sugar O-acetyltransferase [Raoultibacter phocaeensis]
MNNDMHPARERLASGEWCDVADPLMGRDLEHARAVACRFNTDQSLTTDQRTDLLRDVFGSIGEGVTLSLGLWFDFGYNIHIGKGSFVNFNAVFLDGAPIVLGNDVWVGPNVTFSTPMHPLLAEERVPFSDETGDHFYERCEPITVGDNVWIAANVTINPGVTIGEGVVIGSGSVVTKDIPARTIAYGNPCRPVREITEADRIGLRL